MLIKKIMSVEKCDIKSSLRPSMNVLSTDLGSEHVSRWKQ